MTELNFATPPVVSRQDWDEAWRNLLVKEKQLTRARDALAAERRRMPWLAVDKDYAFDGPNGRLSLLDLFQGRLDDADEAVPLLVGHEIVLVLGGDLQVDLRLLGIAEIDDDFNGHQAVENPPQFLGLGSQFGLGRLGQMPMPGGNAQLHVLRSPAIAEMPVIQPGQKIPRGVGPGAARASWPAPHSSGGGSKPQRRQTGANRGQKRGVAAL